MKLYEFEYSEVILGCSSRIDFLDMDAWIRIRYNWLIRSKVEGAHENQQ